MTTTAHATAEAFAASIQEGWAAYIDRTRREPAPHPTVYASAWRPCLRRMVYELTMPERQPPFPADTLARFRRGEDRERDLLIDLARVGRATEPGFDVIGQQQRFELRDHKGRVCISGKVDARLRQGDRAAPLEVKAWSPMLVDRIERFEDLFENPWTRGGANQTLCYLFGAGEPFGFLLLDRSGLPLVLPVELDAHLDRVEDFLTRAEAALDHVAAGTLPDYLVGDAAECRRCPYFGSVCNPPLVYGDLQVLTDPELEALLEQREAVKGPGKEFERLDKEVKARLRGIEAAVAGHFTISGSWGKQSRLELPAALRKQHTVVDPRGRFTLDITRVD